MSNLENTDSAKSLLPAKIKAEITLIFYILLIYNIKNGSCYDFYSMIFPLKAGRDFFKISDSMISLIPWKRTPQYHWVFLTFEHLQGIKNIFKIVRLEIMIPGLFNTQKLWANISSHGPFNTELQRDPAYPQVLFGKGSNSWTIHFLVTPKPLRKTRESKFLKSSIIKHFHFLQSHFWQQ